MSCSTTRTLRYALLAAVIVVAVSSVIAWQVYPKEVAAWWTKANAPKPTPYTDEERQAILTDWLGGEAAIAELRAATDARAYRWAIGRDPNDQNKPVPIEDPVPLSSDQLRRFIEFVTDHSVYYIGKPNRGDPIPSDDFTVRGVTLQIETASRTRDITMWYPGIGVRIFFDHDGDRRYFEPNRLLPLLKELFPTETDW